jgi:hypothetical protein
LKGFDGKEIQVYLWRKSWAKRMCMFMIYDGKAIGIREAFDLHAKGIPLYCPRCLSVLLVALSDDEANRLRIHPGIYCPVNQQHVCTTLSLKQQQLNND